MIVRMLYAKIMDDMELTGSINPWDEEKAVRQTSCVGIFKVTCSASRVIEPGPYPDTALGGNPESEISFVDQRDFWINNICYGQ